MVTQLIHMGFFARCMTMSWSGRYRLLNITPTVTDNEL
jgi:hypothetical protein